MRFVEQPEFGTTGDERRQRGPPSLTGRQSGRGHVEQSFTDPASGQRPVGIHRLCPGCTRPEPHVVGRAEVGVEPVVVGQHPDPATDEAGGTGDVDPQDVRLALHHAQQPGARAEHGGLARSVRPAQEHDLALADSEIDAGESGEPVEEHDSRLQHDRRRRDGGRHMKRPNGTDDARNAPRARTMRPVRLAKVLGGFGRVLIWTGVIILLFVAYQLWGTNLAEARAQDDLESEFEELLVEAPEPDEPTSTSAPEDDSETDTTTTAPEGLFEIPEPGQAMARIEIPEIGVDKIVVEGVSRSDLKKGPGHYPDTPFPGQSGNAAIAGHRTTYGAPFHRIDELGVDDEITVTTLQGRFTYQVIGQEIVTPSDIHVIDDMDDDRLTLTSCHPKYSARQRIIVSAVLVDEPAPPTPRGTREIDQAIETLDGEETGPVAPVIIFGLIALAVWLFFYVLSRKWRRWPAYALGVAPFGVALFVWFGAVAELLPSNF